LDAGVGAGADLISHIQARSWIASDEDDGQAWGRAGLRDDALHTLAAFTTDFSGNRVAVDYLCSHIPLHF
jgi:hypothetical protein